MKNYRTELGISLLDFDSAINLKQDQLDFYLNLLREMLLIRHVEHEIAKLKMNGKIVGPVHLAAGQEAIPVGVSQFLDKRDHVYSAHRSHGHLLALTKNPYPLLAEVLGKETGHSKGFGGSMHLQALEYGFRGSVPIVAGTVALAMGSGFAEKMKKTNHISVAYFGDGAIEEGIIHECLNVSSLMSIPQLFICENNLFSSHMHISQRQPELVTSRFAIANKVKYRVIDGNNISEVLEAAEELISYIRLTGKPAYLEAFTYRLYGHVDWRQDIDVGIQRSQDDLLQWKTRDPILRLQQSLIFQYSVSQELLDSIEKEVIENVLKCTENALLDQTPRPENLLRNVYSDEG